MPKKKTEYRDPNNRYDKNDFIKREGCLKAGALSIAAYRVRDIATKQFGTLQLHMLYHDTVLAVMGEEAAKLFCKFVRSHVEDGGEKTFGIKGTLYLKADTQKEAEQKAKDSGILDITEIGEHKDD